MNLRKLFTKKSEKDQTIDGRLIPAGSKMIKGVRCPECGTFYPIASRISVCNTEGCKFQGQKKIKRHEIKKQLKRIRVEAKKKAEVEQKAKEGVPII